MKLVIDHSLCAGFGDCATAAPHLFELDQQGKAMLVAERTDDPAALDAVAACPMGAISVIELEAAA